MADLNRFRAAMAKYLGQELTPEIACAIEAEAFDVVDRTVDPARFRQTQCGSLVFAVERYSDLAPELEPLHAAHYAETEVHRHELAMRPDHDEFVRLQLAGRMVQFTARCDGALVGHMRWFLHRSLHTSTEFAGEDALYLTEQARRGRAGVRFPEFAIAELRRVLGIREFRASTKAVNSAGRLFEHLGFEPAATQWVLILKE